MKSLNCKDVGVECDFSICAKTEEELLDKAREHARTIHNMKDIPKDLYDKARSAIRDVDWC